MKSISLISDTHSLLAEDVISHITDCDEIWHAGDIGSIKILKKLRELKPLRIVYGNIDHGEIRSSTNLNEIFECEGMKVFMTHIGGYPGRYTNRVKNILNSEKPQLYICGHSHILKVMYDKKFKVFHMNPGACGVQGFHTFRTLLKFDINKAEIQNLRVVELGLRSSWKKQIKKPVRDQQ